MDRIYPKWKEAVAQGSSNSSLAGNVKAVLIDVADYTYDDAHDFLDDVPSGARVATSANLGSKTYTNGVFGAANTTFPAASGDQSEAVIFYIDTGVEATSRLVAYVDGKFQIEVAVNASTSATSVTTEDLPAAFDNGITLTKISGTGPATLTATGSGSVGARSISVSALSGNIVAGAVYEYPASGSGLPVTPNGGDINLNFDTGANKIFAL